MKLKKYKKAHRYLLPPMETGRPRRCMNCGCQLPNRGGHFVPPSFGEAGFFTCNAKTPRPSNPPRHTEPSCYHPEDIFDGLTPPQKKAMNTQLLIASIIITIIFLIIGFIAISLTNKRVTTRTVPQYNCSFCADTRSTREKMPWEWDSVVTACPKCCYEEYEKHLEQRQIKAFSHKTPYERFEEMIEARIEKARAGAAYLDKKREQCRVRQIQKKIS
jgi:hypothetical protein